MVPNVEDKTVQLRNFASHLRNLDGFTLKGFGEVPCEIELLENFDVVLACFAEIDEKYQPVIIDIAEKMSNGMADFLKKKVVTLEDYDLYCWYVAGLVGEGLTRLFVVSGCEEPSVSEKGYLFKSMGLFLQKVNITRDFLEDVTHDPPRIFYPKAIWSQYAKNVTDLLEPENLGSAVLTLNEMVTNAMQHSVDVLDYLQQIKEPSVFIFCAIPQAMAIATLSEIYNNPDIFTGERHWLFSRIEVKVRKTLALKMIMTCDRFQNVLHFFYEFALKIEAEIPDSDPSSKSMKRHIRNLKKRIVNDINF